MPIPSSRRWSHGVIGAALAAVIALTAGTAAAATACYNFSSLATGSTYGVGDVVNGANATFEFKRFQWDNGVWTAGGQAEVDASDWAAGSPPHELELNNIMVRVIPSVPADGASYRYADLGFNANVNFGVNGDFRNVKQLSALDGTVVGGCDISVTEVEIVEYNVVVGWRGVVDMTPQAGVTIVQFGVGGQEFWIDDVCHDW